MNTMKTERSFVLAIASVFLCFIVSACGVSSRCMAGETGAGGATKTSFGAFAFALPSDWARAKPQRTKTAAMLVSRGTGGGVTGFIQVDVGRPTAASPRELAKRLAGSDGKVYDELVKLDGTDAVKVETPSKDLSRPRIAVITFRDGRAYLLMAGANANIDLAEPMDTIVNSWTWAKQ